MAALTTYTPSSSVIVHTTQTDFVDRDTFGTTVHLVQGDDVVPVVAVEMYDHGQPYVVPSGAEGNIRWKKPNPDRHYIYNPLLGLNKERTTAYFEVTDQMSVTPGFVDATIEITIGGAPHNSERLPIIIDANPIKTVDLESSSEGKSLKSYVDAAKQSATDAAGSVSQAASSATQAKGSADNAASSANNAASSATNAAASASQANTSASNAAESAKDAANVALHPPIIRDGNWWTWDTGKNAYVDSGTDAGVSLTVGTVTTGEPGTAAKVTNRGTATDPILDFTIPKGTKGDTGGKGDKGDKGEKGDPATITIVETVTGAPGDPAKVENVGTTTDPKLKFTIPLGNQGPVSSVNGGTGDVVIGGKNYVQRSSPALHPDGWFARNNSGVNLEITPDGYAVSAGFVWNYLSVETPVGLNKNLEPGTYTLSYTAYASRELVAGSYGEGKFLLQNVLRRGANGTVSLGFSGGRIGTVPERYIRTFTITTNEPGDGWAFSLSAYSTNSEKPNVSLYLKDVKIEKGTVATDWSPAPEDYLGSFNAYDITNMHRNIFRGQSLGSTFTAAQKAAIAAGTWDDLYLGDYWTINNRTWRIADFDYWLGKGDTSCTKHHIVVVPDASLYGAQMHNTDSGDYEGGTIANTTEGGYFNSGMRTTNLTRAKTLIETDFGTGSILNHRIMLTNAVKDGYPSGATWYDSEVDLMNEMMVYGAYHLAPRGNGPIFLYNYTTEYTQLALFQVAPYYIMPDRSWYWLRDVAFVSDFACVHSYGMSYGVNASRVRGVRPAVGIVGS